VQQTGGEGNRGGEEKRAVTNHCSVNSSKKRCSIKEGMKIEGYEGGGLKRRCGNPRLGFEITKVSNHISSRKSKPPSGAHISHRPH